MTYTLTDAQKTCQDALDKRLNCTIIKSIRSGKTLTLLDYIKKKKYNQVLWVVPYVTNIEGLKEEINKWKFNSLNIDISTYNSIKKHNNKQYDLIILDECHRITLNYFEDLQTLNYKRVISMTGTYPKKKEKREILEEYLRSPIVYTYSIKDAVKDETVAPFTINLEYKDLSTNNDLLIQGRNKSFYTSEQKNYNYLLKKISTSYSTQKTMAYIMTMRFLNTLPSTISKIKEYINNNNSKRILIFVATKEMAEKCSKYCYYSDKTDKYFKLFQEGKINHLVLVEKGAIGTTYQNLDGCLLTTINGSNASVLQKIFRTILWRENYTANIDILINKNTLQEEWIKKALTGI